MSNVVRSSLALGSVPEPVEIRLQFKLPDGSVANCYGAAVADNYGSPRRFSFAKGARACGWISGRTSCPDNKWRVYASPGSFVTVEAQGWNRSTNLPLPYSFRKQVEIPAGARAKHRITVTLEPENRVSISGSNGLVVTFAGSRTKTARTARFTTARTTTKHYTLPEDTYGYRAFKPGFNSRTGTFRVQAGRHYQLSFSLASRSKTITPQQQETDFTPTTTDQPTSGMGGIGSIAAIAAVGVAAWWFLFRKKGA